MPTKLKRDTPASSSKGLADHSAPEVELRLAALDQENLTLQRRIAKLEAELASARNRVRALEELKPGAAVRTMTDEELEQRFAAFAKQLGYVKPET